MSAIRNNEIENIRQLTNDKSRHRKQKSIDRLSSFLLKFDLFKAILQRNGLTNFQQIAGNFNLRNYGFGETIYNSSESRTFNFIVRGAVMLYTNRPITQQTSKTIDQQSNGAESEPNELHFYKRLVSNQYFGERLYVQQHFKVVCAKSVLNTLVIQLDLAILYKTFSGYFVFKQLEEKVHMLRKVVALRYLSSRKLERILQLGNTKRLQNSHLLFKEGEEPAHFMIILGGQITLTKKVEQMSNKNIQLSILSAFEVLGLTEIMRGEPYYSTAICSADRTQILLVDKDVIRQMFDFQMENQLDVYRYKEDWRKSRIQLLNQTSIRYKKGSSINTPKYNKYVRLLTEPSEVTVEFGFEDRSKLNMTELQTARQKRMIRRFLSQSKHSVEPLRQSTARRTVTSMGDQLFTRYMQKKCKQNYKMLQQYTSSHPPEMSNNPERDFSIVKPLYVSRSNAVRNTKRQLKASRRQIYAEFLNTSISSQKNIQL